MILLMSCGTKPIHDLCVIMPHNIGLKNETIKYMKYKDKVSLRYIWHIHNIWNNLCIH